MRKLNELSGGELQRVAIAHCLSQDADIILMDEPSAYLDVEQRLIVSKVIKEMMATTGKSAIIVDHDLLFIDYLSDKLIVFDGEPAIRGLANPPMSMDEGMKKFLSELNITFRRDEENYRPRINKEDSQKDREQKSSGKLYYH
jgi:ATP-binding cassette subfamily E protein 1